MVLRGQEKQELLEAIRQVATDDDYRLFCVKNNNQPIYEDLISKIEQTGRYLLFVDDANELTGLEHVLQYVNKTIDMHFTLRRKFVMYCPNIKGRIVVF